MTDKNMYERGKRIGRQETIAEVEKMIDEIKQNDKCPACGRKMICPECKITMNDEYYWVNEQTLKQKLTEMEKQT